MINSQMSWFIKVHMYTINLTIILIYSLTSILYTTSKMFKSEPHGTWPAY